MHALNTTQQKLVDEFSAMVGGDARVQRHDLYARLREQLPVFRSERLDAWVVSRYDDCKAVIGGLQFQPPQTGAGSSAFGRSFMQMNGREHSKKIGVVAREMRSPRAMRERLNDVVLQIAQEQAAALPMGEAIELRERYALWVPLLSIAALTDLPEAARFRDWYRRVVAGSSSSITNPAARQDAFTAREEVRAFLEPIIDARRVTPGNDLLSDLVTAEYDGAPIPHEEIVSNVIFLLAAGVETTERVLTSVLRHMALNPVEWEWLKAHYNDAEAISAFCAESLRVFPPVSANIRTALEAVEVAGVTVQPGDKMCALSASGNYDDKHFSDASRFDHNRFMGASDRQFTGGGDILSFGDGMHHCVGARLAKVEMVHALQQLLERVGRIEAAGPLPESEGFIFHSPSRLPVVLHPA